MLKFDYKRGPSYRHKGAPSLEVENLTVRYPCAAQNALEAISFTIHGGERVALVGPNGSGKTTLLKAAAGFLPCEGRLLLCGQPRGRCLHHTAYVAQRQMIDWSFPVTVRDVALQGRTVHLGWFRRAGAHDKKIADEALETLGLSDLAHRPISDLSGGQQQRVFLARALAQEPDLFLLDEPFSGVDHKTSRIIFDLLADLRGKGKTVIVSTHDVTELASDFDRIIVIDRRLIADGPAETVVNSPEYLHTYLHRAHPCAECPPEKDPS